MKRMCLLCVSVIRFKFLCNILISGKIIKEMPGSVASGAPYRIVYCFLTDSAATSNKTHNVCIT